MALSGCRDRQFVFVHPCAQFVFVQPVHSLYLFIPVHGLHLFIPVHSLHLFIPVHNHPSTMITTRISYKQIKPSPGAAAETHPPRSQACLQCLLCC